jgi:TM2 domain-containing membrane protein YozV
MNIQQADMYLMANANYFEAYQIPAIREMLLKADDSRFVMVQSVPLKDPTLMLILSLIAGSLGVDRFLVGDVGLGVAKLLTCGGLGIWAIVDWFLIMGRAREVNYQHLMMAIDTPYKMESSFKI